MFFVFIKRKRNFVGPNIFESLGYPTRHRGERSERVMESLNFIPVPNFVFSGSFSQNWWPSFLKATSFTKSEILF